MAYIPRKPPRVAAAVLMILRRQSYSLRLSEDRHICLAVGQCLSGAHH